MTAANLEPRPGAPPAAPAAEWYVAPPRPTVNLGLRQIMLLLIYCAGLSVVGRHLYQARTPAALGYLLIVGGAGLAYLGVWLVRRLGKFGVLGWAVFVAGYALVTVAVMGPLAIPGVPILIGILVAVHVQYRRHLQGGLLWVLAVAADRRIPLGPGVEVYAQQVGGVFGDRAHALAVGLDRGDSLAAALDRVHRVLPWDVPLLVRIGEWAGRLGPALREAAEAASHRRASVQVVFDRVNYLVVVLLLAEWVLGGIFYYNIPAKYLAIARDIDVTVTGPTAALGAANAVANPALVALGPGALIAIAAGQAVVVASVAAWLARRGFAGVPVLGRLERLRHKSLLLRALALVVAADKPLAPAFAILAAEYPSSRVRRRLAEATGAVGRGVDWVAALRGVGLLSAADAGVLEAAGRAGNLPWAVATLAEGSERRFAYRLEVASLVGFVGAIIALGLLLLGYALAVFVPLIYIIERLS